MPKTKPAAADVNVARGFLETLHGDHEQWFTLFTLPERGCQWLRHVGDEAVPDAIPAGEDVYVSACGFRDRASRGRGKADGVSVMPALWIDIDAGGEKTAKQGKTYPPTLDDCVSLADAMPLQPSLLIRTGGGVHAWWLLSEPFDIETDDDRRQAADLIRRWQATAAAVAAERGWSVDATHDLARVMRVPGTVHQGTGGQVEVMRHDDALRYHAEDVLDRCVADKQPELTQATSVAPVASGGSLDVSPDRDIDDRHVQLSLDDAAFRDTWLRQREDMPDGSPSSYDMAIASAGAYWEWTDQQIADAIHAHRRLHGSDMSKAARRDYIERTIVRARGGVSSPATTEPAEKSDGTPKQPTVAVPEPVDDEPENVDTDVARQHTLEQLRTKLGGLPLKRWLQRSDEAGSEQFSFVLEDGTEIVCGTGQDVLAQAKVRAAIYAQTHRYVDHYGKKTWGNVCKALAAIVEVVPIEEDTRQGHLASCIEQYLSGRRIGTEDSKDEAIEHGKPFVADGMMHIHTPDLTRWAAMEKIKIPQIHKTMNEAGWREVRLRRAGSKRRPRYYQRPVDEVMGEDDE